MAVGTGTGINLDALNSAIDDAEKKFKKLTTTGVNTARAIDEAFKIAANGGLKQFRDGIAGLDAALKGKGADKAIKDIGTSAVDSANKITQLVESIRGGGERFTDLMARINDRGAYNPKNGALESVNTQLDEQRAKLKELKDLLNFYAKGEGLKAVDTAVHPKEYIEAKEREAEATMRLIEKLEQEKKERESLARLQRELAKRQGGIDANYEPRLLEYTQGYKHRMQMESTYAKYSSKLYEDTYNEQIRSYEQLWDKVEKGEKNRDERIAKQKIAEYKATMSEMMALDKAMYSSQKEGKANTAEYDAIEARYKKLVDRKLALEAELDKRIADLKEKADVRNKAEEQKRAIQSGKEQQRIADKASKEAIAKARQTEKEKLALYKATLTEMKSLDKNIYRVDTKGTDAEKNAIAETRNRYKELEAQKTALEAELGRKTTDIRKKFEAEVESETAKRLIRERELREAENKRALQEAKANAKQQAAENKRAENEKIATYRATLAELKSLDKDKYAIESKGKQVQEADKYQKILDRERDLNAKKLDLENQLGSKVNEIRRRFDTERLGEIAKRHIREIELEEKAADNAAKVSSEARRKRYQEYVTSYEGAMRTSQRASTKGSFAEEEQAIKNLEAVRDKLKKSDADYAVKLNALNEAIKRHEKSLKDATKTDKDRADEAAKNAKKIADAQAKYDSISRRERYKAYTTSYEGAIRTSDRAKTLAQEIQAVKNLEAARAKLSRTDTNYQKKMDDINARILQHNKNIQQATAGAKDLEKAHSSLGTKIASVFSIQAIRGYINQMIKVRGEMELQQRSLQAILQNKAAANEVWQKTIDLAVRSPFRIKDLVTYTKQLAAYRVEADKLYDTNKMLADVSAGLGVDMQRLILAFGQVKSANFLRGTELRQFTEAGIPMLDELAKLYTQMEGATVTAADVFDRISKRMVLFEDVEEVFKRMTAAGGTFYRMQEIQSETLKGQISNLKDSIDIMLNSMGKATDGVLKKSVKAVKFLVDNYQALIPVLKAVIAALALYKINSFKASEATLRMARAIGVTTKSSVGFNAAWASLRVGVSKFTKEMGKSLKVLASNPWILLITAIATAAIKLNQFRKELREVDKEYSKLINKQEDVYLAFRQAGQKGDLEEQIAERRKQLQALVDTAKNEYGITIDINVGEVDETKLEEEFNKIRQKMLETNAFSAKFTKEMMKSDKLSKWVGTDGVTFEEGLFEDIQDVGDSYEKLYQEMMSTSGRVTAKLRDDWDNLTDKQKTAVETLEKPIQADESVVDYVERLKDAFVELNKISDVKNNKISRFIRSFNNDVREAEVEFKLFAERFKDEVNNIVDEEKKIEFLDVSIGAMADKKEWSEFEENYIRRLVEQEFGITFVPKIATTEELKAWQKSYESLFKGFTGYRDLAPSTSQSQVIERLQGTYESLAETIERIEKAGKDSVLEGGAYYDERGKSLQDYKKELEDVAKQLKWFGVDSTTKDGKGKDEVLEKLKERINLIKEMNKEYEKLNKTFSKAESLAKVQKAYADTAKELGLDTSTMDFTDEGTIKSLEALLGKPEYAANKYVIELQKALDNFKVELGVEVKQEKDKDLKSQVQELFDRYELTVDLKKLNLPREAAEELFDVKYLDLDGLRKAVQDKASEFVGTDQYEKYQDYLDKIDEMERKSIVERTKTYAEYLTRGMNERVKLKVEELRKLKELEESKEFNPDQKEQIRGQIKADTQKALDKESWKQFQATEWYTLMFTDLETLGTQAIKNLHDELSQLKDSLSHLDPSEVKEIVNQMDKLQEQLIKRNPFDAFVTARQNIKALAQSEEDVMSQLKAHEDNQAYAQKMLDMLAEIEVARAEYTLGDLQGETLALFQSLRAEVFKGNKNAFKDARKEYEGLLAKAKEGADLTSEQIQMFAQYRQSLQGISDYWGTINDQIQNLAGSAINIMEVYGVDEATKSIAEGVGSMSTLITQAVQFGIQMELVGYKSNMALGVIGWIAMGIQAIATTITAIANYKNAKIDAQLEKQAKAIERQRDLYEEIEKKVDAAYNVDQLRKYNGELERSVELEIQALEASIAMERSRKNADEDQIADWQKEITEARERLAESKQEMMEELGGMFDITDFTSGFVDAWWDAMDEGKSGLDALGEHFEETMKDMVKKQALYQGANAIMKQVQDVINQDLADDYDIDDWQNIWDVAKKANVDLDAFLQGWYDMFGGLSDGASGGLSALQKGIQGVSEETAQVIEAYLNSIRGYVSEQVTHTRNIYRILNDAVHSDAAAIRVRMV